MTRKALQSRKQNIARSDGVNRLCELMCQDAYHGLNKRAQAEEWGISWPTFEAWAAEASRRIRTALPDEEFVGRIIEELAEIARLAKEDGKYGPAVGALRVMLEARGLLNKAAEHAVRQVEALSLDEQVRILVSEPEMREALRRALETN